MELLETINHAPKGDISMIPQKQLSLADIFEDCKEIYESDKPQFLTLLENHIDLDEIVPISFYNHYYASTGRNRKYPLNAMLWALIIQRLFSIPTDSLLLVFLHYSRHLREFCGFTKVPDASKITRFKQDFLQDLQLVFDNFVDVTEPICQDIDNNLASMLLFDTSGIEAYVTENNPKYANRIIKQLKAYAKALLPTLKDFKIKHPNINPDIFLGDAAFDTIEIYKYLFEDFSFKKAFIPLKTKLSMDNVDYTFNENGIPCCPHDPSLPMKREGSKSHLRSKLPTMKFVCPKMKWAYNCEDKSKRRVCQCDNPCTTSSCGRMIYVYPEKNLRAYPGVECGSKEWDETYKIRVNVEKSINHFKDSFCVANRKTSNEKTIHADLLLAGISQLLTVIVADKINQRNHIRSLKSYIT